MAWWAYLFMAVPLAVTVLGMRYDRRSEQEKLRADRRKLGAAVGVPGLFDRPEDRHRA